MSEAPGPVLQFWFGESADDAAVAKQQSRLWWGGKRADDDAIRERFSSVHRSAVSGELEDWARDPRGRLALIIVVDQFSRALFRGKPDRKSVV